MQKPDRTTKPQSKEVLTKKRAFYQVLINNTFAAIINFTVWFAITFFTYLQTRSVFATAIISGLYLVAVAGSGIWFGSLVDHHRKKQIMLLSSWGSLAAFLVAFGLHMTAPDGAFKDVASPTLWAFILLLMFGVIIGNLRMIAGPTIVTMLIPADERDKANGLAGTAGGLAMLVTSVISGVLVGMAGMLYVLVLAVIGTILAILHLQTVSLPEKKIIHTPKDGQKLKKVDIKGTLAVIGRIPGLYALIAFTTFNNFLGGVFMALMDAYGLSLVSVEVWGFLWGFLSLGFIIGGTLIATKGLGKNPLRTLLLANIVIWIVSIFFTVQSSIILLTVGTLIYMIVMPAIEASEQTVLQKVVPPERQGRVFGFAQSVEQAASPLTAFLIGPLAQFVFIPLMATGGAGADLIGSWYGTGQDRGIAIIFSIAGIIGLIVTLLALGSSQYRKLSKAYLSDSPRSSSAPAIK